MCNLGQEIRERSSTRSVIIGKVTFLVLIVLRHRGIKRLAVMTDLKNDVMIECILDL